MATNKPNGVNLHPRDTIMQRAELNTSNKVLFRLHAMTRVEINTLAVSKLLDLNERCTLNLVTELTGISRTTLYKWLDDSIAYEDMNHRDAAWFILYCETSPRVKMLLDRPPLSHPRMARKLLEGTNDGD